MVPVTYADSDISAGLSLIKNVAFLRQSHRYALIECLFAFVIIYHIFVYFKCNILLIYNIFYYFHVVFFYQP